MSFTSKRVVNYFFKGLLFVAPLALTVYIIYYIVQFLDNLLPVPVPGLGILIVFGLITFIGYLANIFITKPIFELVERWLFRIPLVNILYTSIKDLMSAFVGDKKKFNTPVIVKLSEHVSRLGFITQEDLSMIGEEDLVAVYLPHSYNFSGNCFLAPRSNVRVLHGANSTEVMKFIVSGGVSELSDPKK
ncbi:hypothetical protein DN752_15760 [Echinicola strongylocentroti]|uniref:DUF502 domain-containing protein n=1 Tax=Echinicola strongylocentroti TaxID=1795355 RepID=A0A2Z4IK07_9BACT|nr:DUF502 domain-containing protein [Echinicola strongylocentroti]AWW31461.1 hypothetical protein DN752_15760 [Echinicola strongylocentroti]